MAYVRMNARVPGGLWEAFRGEAAACGVSASWLLREVMAERCGLAVTDVQATAGAVVPDPGPRLTRPARSSRVLDGLPVCPHPKSAKRDLGYVVVCGDCGVKLR